MEEEIEKMLSRTGKKFECDCPLPFKRTMKTRNTEIIEEPNDIFKKVPKKFIFKESKFSPQYNLSEIKRRNRRINTYHPINDKDFFDFLPFKSDFDKIIEHNKKHNALQEEISKKESIKKTIREIKLKENMQKEIQKKKKETTQPDEKEEKKYQRSLTLSPKFLKTFNNSTSKSPKNPLRKISQFNLTSRTILRNSDSKIKNNFLINNTPYKTHRQLTFFSTNESNTLSSKKLTDLQKTRLKTPPRKLKTVKHVGCYSTFGRRAKEKEKGVITRFYRTNYSCVDPHIRNTVNYSGSNIKTITKIRPKSLRELLLEVGKKNSRGCDYDKDITSPKTDIIRAFDKVQGRKGTDQKSKELPSFLCNLNGFLTQPEFYENNKKRCYSEPKNPISCLSQPKEEKIKEIAGVSLPV